MFDIASLRLGFTLCVWVTICVTVYVLQCVQCMRHSVWMGQYVNCMGHSVCMGHIMRNCMGQYVSLGHSMWPVYGSQCVCMGHSMCNCMGHHVCMGHSYGGDSRCPGVAVWT